jgi:hypothetical protein
MRDRAMLRAVALHGKMPGRNGMHMAHEGAGTAREQNQSVLQRVHTKV